MPRITGPSWSPIQVASVRIPQILRPFTSTSFGHLSASAPSGSSGASVWATASPPAMVRRGSRSGTTCGRSTMLHARLVPGGDCQARPPRPRPAVCSSAMTTAPLGSAGSLSAHSRAMSCVLSTRSKNLNGRAPNARRRLSVENRSVMCSAPWSCAAGGFAALIAMKSIVTCR